VIQGKWWPTQQDHFLSLKRTEIEKVDCLEDEFPAKAKCPRIANLFLLVNSKLFYKILGIVFFINPDSKIGKIFF
jgi:hypothetical protein